MTQFTNASNPVVLKLVGMSYKPFIGVFNMTGVAEAYPEVAGIGESLID